MLAVDLDGASVDESAVALHHGDPAAGDESGQALEQPRRDGILILLHASHVDVAEAGSHTELVGFADRVGDLRGVQERLGRNATVVQAGSAELIVLDQQDVLAELSGAQRAGISGATATDDGDVEVVIRHVVSSFGVLRSSDSRWPCRIGGLHDTRNGQVDLTSPRRIRSPRLRGSDPRTPPV